MCTKDLSRCTECTGSACLRITARSESSISNRRSSTNLNRHQMSNIDKISLTCVPDSVDTDAYPDGCRWQPAERRQTCICYRHDYCNGAGGIVRSAQLIMQLLLPIVAILVATD